jgi:hypothetical protein
MQLIRAGGCKTYRPTFPVHVARGNPAAIAATAGENMSKEQKMAFLKSLKYEGVKTVRKDGRIIVYRAGELACMVEARPNGSIEITRCGAGSGLVKACLYEALA